LNSCFKACRHPSHHGGARAGSALGKPEARVRWIRIRVEAPSMMMKRIIVSGFRFHWARRLPRTWACKVASRSTDSFQRGSGSRGALFQRGFRVTKVHQLQRLHRQRLRCHLGPVLAWIGPEIMTAVFKCARQWQPQPSGMLERPFRHAWHGPYGPQQRRRLMLSARLGGSGLRKALRGPGRY
jgi:hypothetical protein